MPFISCQFRKLSWNDGVSVSGHDEIKNRGLTGGVVMTTDVRSTVVWELLENLKPRSVFKPNSSSLLFAEVSYPHPWRELRLLKREDVYNFAVTKFKRRYLELYFL